MRSRTFVTPRAARARTPSKRPAAGVTLALSLVLVLVLGNTPSLLAQEAQERAQDATTEQRIERLEAGLDQLSRDVQALRALVETLVQARPEAAETPAQQQTLQTLRQLEAQNEELKSQQEALAASVRSAEASLDYLSDVEQQRTQVTVYGTVNYIDGQDENSAFDAKAFELVLSGRPHPRLGFFAEIEFERAATVGGSRSGEVLLEQAYAAYEISPLFNLRAGVLLVPFGNYNLNHYSPARDVITRPLVSHVVAPADWTDNGIGLTGEAFLGDLWGFQYQLYTVAGLGDGITALGSRAGRQSFGEDNNNNKAVVGRFAWNRGNDLELGLSGYSGKYDDAGRLSLDGWAGDIVVRFLRLEIAAEYNYLEGERLVGSPAILDGYYGRVVLDVTPGAWRRGSSLGQLFPDASLDLVAQVDRVAVEGPLDGNFERNEERRTTFGLSFRPSHQWVFKLNWEENKATNRPLQRGDFRGWLASIGFQF